MGGASRNAAVICWNLLLPLSDTDWSDGLGGAYPEYNGFYTSFLWTASFKCVLHHHPRVRQGSCPTLLGTASGLLWGARATAVKESLQNLVETALEPAAETAEWGALNRFVHTGKNTLS